MTIFQTESAAPTRWSPHAQSKATFGEARAEGFRRVLNVTVAMVALVLLAPLMVCIAVLVKLSSPGPVFYTQWRVGVDRRRSCTSMNARRRVDHGGRPFKIYKFRTMTSSSAGNGNGAGGNGHGVGGNGHGQVWAKANDPRVTNIGRFLRSTRLDELPQLWNVVRGDMNVVGPRPEQMMIFISLRNEIAQYHARQRVRPGITGWAQINQSYDTCVDDVRRKLEFDLEYLERQSVSEDLRIMIRTLPVMLFQRGTR
jgi:lipopolysaccharide/colanic/teichoic acid biosynthesis glycosyltransferase